MNKNMDYWEMERIEEKLNFNICTYILNFQWSGAHMVNLFHRR